MYKHLDKLCTTHLVPVDCLDLDFLQVIGVARCLSCAQSNRVVGAIVGDNAVRCSENPAWLNQRSTADGLPKIIFQK